MVKPELLSSTEVTDPINELLTRGVEAIYPSREYLEFELRSGRKLNVYMGIDPTAPSLHLGHIIQLHHLRRFQELGHHVTLLLGGCTARVGDPTDKTATRRKLTAAEVNKNAEKYVEQAGKILDINHPTNPIAIRDNNEWLDPLNTPAWMELTSEATVQQMMERDMFKKRWEEGKPISIVEFLYPFMQGYDSVAMNIDVEVGGKDQIWNMLFGADMVRRHLKKQKFVLAGTLLTDTSGKKMGKTEGGVISFSDEPLAIYQKVMMFPDDWIVKAYTLCTAIPMAEISQIESRITAGTNLLEEKKHLAWTITAMMKNPEDATNAQTYYNEMSGRGQVSKELETTEIRAASEEGLPLPALLVQLGLAGSNSEARRLIAQGGVTVDDERVLQLGSPLTGEHYIKVGKRATGRKRVKIVSS